MEILTVEGGTQLQRSACFMSAACEGSGFTNVGLCPLLVMENTKCKHTAREDLNHLSDEQKRHLNYGCGRCFDIDRIT
jgi:hypothetical protein